MGRRDQMTTVAEGSTRYKAGVLKYAQMGYWEPRSWKASATAYAR